MVDSGRTRAVVAQTTLQSLSIFAPQFHPSLIKGPGREKEGTVCDDTCTQSTHAAGLTCRFKLLQASRCLRCWMTHAMRLVANDSEHG